MDAELSLAFCETRPSAAATVLEGFAAADAGEVIAELPARVAAPVLAAMVSGAAIRVLEQLPDDRAADMLRAMDEAAAVRLLRQLDAARRDPLLAGLPARTTRRFAGSLRFHDSLVGAWIDSQAPTMPSERDVGQCLQAYRRHASRAGSLLFLAGKHQRFAGAVPIERLLSAPERVAVSELVDPEIEPIPIRASVATARTHPAWARHPVLPVVGADHGFRGSISLASLNRALGRTENPLPDRDQPATLLGELAAAWVVAMRGIGAALARDLEASLTQAEYGAAHVQPPAAHPAGPPARPPARPPA